MPTKAQLKRELLREQGPYCAVDNHSVSSARGLQLDRIIPGKFGGRYERGNVQLACGKCNRRKGARLLPR